MLRCFSLFNVVRHHKNRPVYVKGLSSGKCMVKKYFILLKVDVVLKPLPEYVLEVSQFLKLPFFK